MDLSIVALSLPEASKKKPPPGLRAAAEWVGRN